MLVATKVLQKKVPQKWQVQKQSLTTKRYSTVRRDFCSWHPLCVPKNGIPCQTERVWPFSETKISVHAGKGLDHPVRCHKNNFALALLSETGKKSRRFWICFLKQFTICVRQPHKTGHDHVTAVDFLNNNHGNFCFSVWKSALKFLLTLNNLICSTHGLLAQSRLSVCPVDCCRRSSVGRRRATLFRSPSVRIFLWWSCRNRNIVHRPHTEKD